MRNLLRPEEQLFHKRLPKKLEFGHTFVSQYKKHVGGAVKSIFWNPNTQAYVSYNEKSLHVWKPDTEEQIFYVNFFDETKSHSISCIVYSARYHLYLAISSDFKLHIFNEHLHHIKALPLKIRLITYAYFYEKESRLITAGIDGCCMFDFQVICKYEPKQALLLDPEGNTMDFKLGPKIKLEKMPLWIKGLKVDEKQGIIFTWSQLKTCFNDISTGNLYFKYKSLSTYEDYITDLIISEEFKYFITSTFFGHIFVWKLQQHRKMIHSFGGHSKTVTSLCIHPKQKTLFISASNDNTVRIWCLDKFTELYCFELPAGINNIKLMTESIFACFYQDAIKIGKLHHLALSFTNSRSDIVRIGKCFADATMRAQDKTDAVFTLFKDNSSVLQSSHLDTLGRTISTIYPPPTAKEVISIAFSSLLKRMFLLLASGTLCIYRVDRDTAILEKLQNPNQLKDSEGKALVTQQITSMQFVSTRPPKYDCEIFTEHNNKKARDQDEALEKAEGGDEASFIDNYLVFGLSKGTIIFIPLDNLEQIYSRFSIHRQQVEQIYELKHSRKFITICQELSLNIWGFQNGKSHIYKQCFIFRPITDIKILQNLAFVGFRTGDTEMFLWEEKQKEFYRLSSDKIDEHEDELMTIDVLHSKGLFVTGAKDGLIKVWNIKKQMVREIKFPEPITAACFLNSDGDILVGHVGKVSSVMSVDYKPFENKEHAQPPEFEVYKFLNQSGREPVTEMTFKNLKKQDDEIRKQLAEVSKRISIPAITQGEPLQNEDQLGSQHESPMTSPKKKNKDKLHSKSLDRRQESNLLFSERSHRTDRSSSIESQGSLNLKRKWSPIATNQDQPDENNIKYEEEKRKEEFAKSAAAAAQKRAEEWATKHYIGIAPKVKAPKPPVGALKKDKLDSPVKPTAAQIVNNSLMQPSVNTGGDSSMYPLPPGSVNGTEQKHSDKSKDLSKEEEIAKKPLSSEEIKTIIMRYQPGKVTALPQTMNQHASQLTLLRQLQNRTNMTRREITENRIIQNILLHNDPKEMQIYNDLFISTRSVSSEALLALQGQHQSSVSIGTFSKNIAATLQVAGHASLSAPGTGMGRNHSNHSSIQEKRGSTMLMQHHQTLPMLVQPGNNYNTRNGTSMNQNHSAYSGPYQQLNSAGYYPPSRMPSNLLNQQMMMQQQYQTAQPLDTNNSRNLSQQYLSGGPAFQNTSVLSTQQYKQMNMPTQETANSYYNTMKQTPQKFPGGFGGSNHKKKKF